MALQGTLDTFALPDVLRLLVSTHKTGCLSVRTDLAGGAVTLSGGKLAGTALDDPPAAGDVDALFRLLRSDHGSFEFEPDVEARVDGLRDLEPVLVEAEGMLREWNEIVAVIPSERSRLALAEDLPEERVTVDRETWRRLATVGGGVTTAELGRRLGVGELDAFRGARDLIERGLVVVGDEEPLPAPEGPAAAPADTVAPAVAPVAAPADAAGHDVVPSAWPPPDLAGLDSAIADGAGAAAEELSDLPEPLPERVATDRFGVFAGAGSASDTGAASDSRGAADAGSATDFGGVSDSSGAADDEPDGLAALSPQAAHAVATAVDLEAAAMPGAAAVEAQDGGPAAEQDAGDPETRSLLHRFLGSGRD